MNKKNYIFLLIMFCSPLSIMEEIAMNCFKHNRPNELVCETCKQYLCPECVTDHMTLGHPLKFTHVMQYAPKVTFPKLDKLIEDTKVSEKTINVEAPELVAGLQSVLPQLKELVKTQTNEAKTLKQLVSQMKSYSTQRVGEIPHKKVLDGLDSDKKRLEKVIKEKNLKEAIKMTQKIETEAELVKTQETPENLLKEISDALVPLENSKLYNNLLNAMGYAITKCQFLRLMNYTSEWKCDRTFFGSKMFLSEDCLTFGNTASNGYPAIIGDVPMEAGLFAWEVIPTGLNCTGSEGFGIIERERYLAIHRNNPTTPEVRNDIIGYMYRNQAKNMETVKMSDMVMSSKYYVKVNMIEHTCYIFGTGVFLKATLKPDTIYAPCFSCGCSGNRMQIRPLESYDEVEDPQ